MNTFNAWHVGDMVTISSLLVMQDHNVMELECNIVDSRRYREQKGLFTYEGYACVPATKPDANPYLVLVRTVGAACDHVLFRLDKGVPVQDAAPHVLTANGDDFLHSHKVYIEDTTGEEHEIVWEKGPSGTFFGVAYQDEEVGQGIKTICEFVTKSEGGGLTRSFVDWSGDHQNGWLEFWVGDLITAEELKFHKPFAKL
jgi:hypothetical protein